MTDLTHTNKLHCRSSEVTETHNTFASQMVCEFLTILTDDVGMTDNLPTAPTAKAKADEIIMALAQLIRLLMLDFRLPTGLRVFQLWDVCCHLQVIREPRATDVGTLARSTSLPTPLCTESMQMQSINT